MDTIIQHRKFMDKDGNLLPRIQRPESELPPFPRLPLTLEHPIKTSRSFYSILVQEFDAEDLLNPRIWGPVPKYLTEVRTIHESNNNNE